MKYERTGEFRAPRKGEWYECNDNLGSPAREEDNNSRGQRWILREVKEPKRAEEQRPGTEEVLTGIADMYVRDQWKGVSRPARRKLHVQGTNDWDQQQRRIYKEARRRVRVVGRLEEYLKDPYANSPDAAVLVFEIQGILKGEGV